MNSKKIIVSTLALVMGAALAGSISGTVAWYQYSTRVTVGMSGTSAGTSRSLQIASELSAPKASDNLTDTHWGYNVAPASKNAVAPTTVLFDDGIIVDFASHPVYQYFNEWNEASVDDYFQYNLYLQNLDLKGDKRLASDVYLTGYELEAGADILADALRIEIVPYTISAGEWVKGTPRLLSKKGGTTTIADYLNLNTERNDVMDHNGFFADDSDGVATKYKANTKVTKADGDDATGLYSDAACSVPAVNKYSKVAAGTEDGTGWFKDEAMTDPAPATLENGVTYWHAGVAAGEYFKVNEESYTTLALTGGSSIVANDADPYNFTNKTTPIVTTSDTYAVKLTVKVWLEGWQEGADVAKVLDAGTDTKGYYTDVAHETEAPVGHAVDKSDGDDGSNLYTTAACTTPVANKYSKVAAGTEDGTGWFKDEAMTDPAPATLVASTTYWHAGVAAGTYYEKGADGTTTYHTKGYIWDDAAIGENFKLNLRFGVEAAE